MKYGFLRTAAVSPALHVADCAYNTQQIIAAMRAQAVAGTKLLCLPGAGAICAMVPVPPPNLLAPPAAMPSNSPPSA